MIRDTIVDLSQINRISRGINCYFADDNPQGWEDVLPEEIPEWSKVLVGIGDNFAREKVVNRLKSLEKQLIFVSVRHPTSHVSRNVGVGRGAVVFAKAAVNTDVLLGDFSIVNTGATVDHDCEIGDFTHIAPGVNLCGTVKVGNRTIVGVGSCARPEVTIGSDTIIGAGSVIVSDIPSGVVAHGNPCRVIKEIS